MQEDELAVARTLNVELDRVRPGANGMTQRG
jgi:hypothetical protein